MVRRIGFTGTRKGMTKAQMKSLLKVLEKLKFREVHHGDCIGADKQFHNLIRLFFPKARIVIHPPNIPTYRAFCKGDIILPEKYYLDRNEDIVKSSDIIIACPKEFKEVKRSGTWSTVRCARRLGKSVIIIYPDGSIEYDIK